MLEEHSFGLVAATLVSCLVFVFGSVVNLSNLALSYTSTHFLVNFIRKGVTNVTSTYILPVTPADWSMAIWGVVYVCQLFWLVYALTAICRKTHAGPAYNSPKLLPVQFHIFFSLTVLAQVGWLVLMDRQYMGFALFLLLISTVCSLTALGLAYRAFSSALPILQQENRLFDIWAVRLFAHNSLAFLLTWLTLYMTFNFSLVLAFSVDLRVTASTSAIVELCCVATLVFCYTLADMTVCETYSRYVFLPYVALILFLASQIFNDFPSWQDPIFILLSILQAVSFILIVVKIIVSAWTHVAKGNPEAGRQPRTLAMDEETFLLSP